MPEALALTAAPEDAGERADVVLGRRLPALSRRVARSLALAGHLRVDGNPAPPSHRVTPGQRLELLLPARTTPPPLIVLAATDRFIYALKPAGTHTHRLRPDDPPALADAVAALHPECAAASPEPREGGAVHRLDHGTSGVVAFARDPAAFTAARSAFTAARVSKNYLALVTCPEGHLWPPTPRPWLTVHADHLELTAPIGPGPRPALVAIRPDGQPSRTTVHPPTALPARPTLASITLDLHTGRRHQARVHLAWLGLPILGDTTYGGAPADRLHLHAASLDLRAAIASEHPVHAPPPPEFT